MHEGGVVVDAVDLYCAKFAGRLAVTLSAAVVGSLLGLALSAVGAWGLRDLWSVGWLAGVRFFFGIVCALLIMTRMPPAIRSRPSTTRAPSRRAARAWGSS